MKSLEDNMDIFVSLNTVAVGISLDSIPCKKEWAENLGISKTPLLCDFWPHGMVLSSMVSSGLRMVFPSGRT